MLSRLIPLAVLTVAISAQCNENDLCLVEEKSQKEDAVSELLRMYAANGQLPFQCIEVEGGKVYIIPEMLPDILVVIDQELYICKEDSIVSLSGESLEKKKGNVPRTMAQAKESKDSKDSDANKEAQEHYQACREALLDALALSLGAAASVEIPPVAIISVYQASQKWIDAAKEYNAAKEAESKRDIDHRLAEGREDNDRGGNGTYDRTHLKTYN